MTTDTNLSTPEPSPTPGRGDIWALVMEDFHARRAMGIAKYGTPLQAGNGRRPLVDLYQELLDAVVYTRQEIEERASLPFVPPEPTPPASVAEAVRERCAKVAESAAEHQHDTCDDDGPICKALRAQQEAIEQAIRALDLSDLAPGEDATLADIKAVRTRLVHENLDRVAEAASLRAQVARLEERGCFCSTDEARRHCAGLPPLSAPKSDAGPPRCSVCGGPLSEGHTFSLAPNKCDACAAIVQIAPKPDAEAKERIATDGAK